MRILITGGAGFIGSSLCDQLINQKHTVFCIDNFYTSNKQNISHLISHPNFYLIKEDISKQINFSTQVDKIYNLACPASPIHYQRDPVHTIETCINGTHQMLKLAREMQADILQASTSEVYGDPEIHPQHELYNGNVNPIGVRSCYDEGKRAAEALCFTYHRQYKVKIKVIRIFNTYGPKMAINDGRVISNFIVQALKSKPITIYGNGNQTRSFQYIDDLLSGMQKMMNNDITGPINLGNPVEFTMNELAETVIKLTNTKSRIIYKDLPLDDPKKRKPDIAEAKKLLNWSPNIQLKTGLNNTIKYFKSIL